MSSSSTVHSSGSSGWGIIIILFILVFIALIIAGFSAFREFSGEVENLTILQGAGNIIPFNNLFFEITTGSSITLMKGTVSIGNVLRINNRTGGDVNIVPGDGVTYIFSNTVSYVSSGSTARLIYRAPNTWLRF